MHWFVGYCFEALNLALQPLPSLDDKMELGRIEIAMPLSGYLVVISHLLAIQTLKHYCLVFSKRGHNL